MEFLQSQLKTNPNATSLDLEFQSIIDLKSLLPLLSQFNQLSELSLSGNRLKSLPDNLSSLVNLQSLDLTNNMFPSIENILPSLATLPKLTKLSIQIKGKEEETLIMQMLPQLQFVNNQSLSQQKISSNVSQNPQQFNEQKVTQLQDQVQSKQQQMQTVTSTQLNNNASQNIQQEDGQVADVTLLNSDLENVAILYDEIRNIYRENNSDNDKQLSDEFEEHIKNVMQDLISKMKVKSPEYITNAHILQSKFSLYEICFSSLINFMKNFDPRIVQITEKIHDAHLQLFEEQQQQILNLNINNQYGTDKKQDEIQYWQNENKELKQQIQELEDENKKYLEIITKHSKTNKNSVQAQFQSNNQDIVNDSQVEIPQSQKPSQQLQQSSSPQQSQGYTQNQVQEYDSDVLQGPSTVRTLTINQLKDMVKEIYASKQLYDQKYLEAKLPRETMEQHMYTFLNQKYGLKTLIIEWATAIINGIKKFSKDENDIAVFGKILRNECDEEFRFVQNQVKNTISELLKMYLRGKYPFKHNSEIKEMLNLKIKGWIYEDEATDIIKYMYNQDDSEQLIEKLKTVQKVAERTPEELKKMTREERLQLMNEKEKFKIEYGIFQKIILDFQLKCHEKFLKQFNSFYKQVDQDHNGIIDEEEFRSLLQSMNISKEETECQRYLNQLDPYLHQQITYSQCVTLFSSEIIQQGNTQISILQKLAMEQK